MRSHTARHDPSRRPRHGTVVASEAPAQGLGGQISRRLAIFGLPPKPGEKSPRVPVVEDAEGIRITPPRQTKQVLVEHLVVHHLTV